MLSLNTGTCPAKKTMAALLCCLVATMFLGSSALCSELSWSGYGDGLKAASDTGKIALVTFSTSWCTECKKMERDVLSREDVIAKINADFVPVKVDGDRQNDIAGKYAVFSYPTYVMLDGDGNVLYKCFGSMSADNFKCLLDYVSTGAFRDMSLADYVKGK